MENKLKVSVIGCGNWGSAAAKTISENTARRDIFDPTVRMWVLEEIVQNRKLSEIINSDHENIKYLPGVKLPSNLKAIPDLDECTKDADVFVFVVPHQFIKSTAAKMKASGLVKPSAIAISLIKGLELTGTMPILLTDLIEQEMGIPCCALSGANVAASVAREEFSEATIGYKVREHAEIFQKLFDRPYYKITCLSDVAGLQVYGAIKNVVALAAGFCDGLNLGSNTKAAIMRIGLKEIHNFAKLFFHHVVSDVVFESAGVADLITTCIGGRNVRCASEFAKNHGKHSWESIENEMLNGQKLQGVSTCAEVYRVISNNGKKAEFPLFDITYQIAFEGRDPKALIDHFQVDALQPF
ncbi:bifunctional Glycerol-3-phosphate dehydrogenase [Babesia duncani]|uniref:Glycerol-3-phosphate dehydrogenase [NAD(+)] n=1 Tax=Babesia duncani TaxID=323732 RepID=A0AAD9PLX5_9APIC|nr:bifunctional Glycerol-3-phosphate dehydrogenase [Babesia duncani]